MAEQIGRLFVAVDAKISPALTALKELDKQAIRTAQSMRTIGGANGGLDRTAVASKKAGDSAKQLGTAANKAAGDVKKLGSAAGGAGRPLNQLQTSMYRLSQSFINLRYGNPIGTVVGLTQSMGGMAGAARGASASIGVLGGGVAALVTAVVALGAGAVLAGGAIGKFGLQAASNLEMLRIQYEGLLGSAGRARAEVDYLLELGQQSIIPTEGLFEANRLLLAYGVTADGTRRQLVKFMSDFGSATGIPAARLQDMAYALGQIQAQGKANQIDMRQLANAGLNLEMVYARVAKQQKISVAEAKNLTEEGKLTAAILIPAITSLGGKYADAAEKARNSAQGILANIKDIAKVKVGLAFESLLTALKPVLKWVEDFVKAFNFEDVAKGFQSLLDSVKTAMGGITIGAEEAGDSLGTFIGEVLVTLGANLQNIIRLIRSMVEVIHQIGRSIYYAAQNIIIGFAKVMGFLNDSMDWLGIVSDEAGQKARDGFSEMESAAQKASDNAVAEIESAAKRLDEIWSQPSYKALYFYMSPLEKGIASGQVPKQAADPQPKWYTDMLDRMSAGADTSITDDKKKGGSKKIDPLIEKLKKLGETVVGLQDITRRPFGEKSFIQKEFGDISSADKIISAFDKTKKAVVDFYDASAALATKAGKSLLGKRKDRTLADLRDRTQELVNLANENKRLAKELDDWRKAEGLRVQSDIDSLKNTYEGYNDARGYAVKGLIQNAQDALDAATQAYDDANSKLQDLISARDDFLNSIRESARSFVNALSVSSEMVQEYTRLDDVGSFMINEKQKSASLKEQMASRLETVKKFAENMKILMAQGLNGQLLQDLVNAGPEAAGDAMQELVNGGQASIDEINQIQSELDAVIGGIQGSASAAWFDPAINIQQGVVNQLATQKAAAEQALRDAQAAYTMRLAQLEEYQKNVEAGTDAHSLALTDRIKANETAAQEIADGMQAKLAWLTDPKNKKNTDVLGNAAIAGFIAGMKSQRRPAIDAAQDIANAVSSTIANAFKIKSPSRLMMQYGSWVSEGLAIGMESALPKVEAASLRMSQAALPSISGDGPGAPTIIVKIGERELTDIVNTEVISHDQRQVDFVLAGRR